MIIGISGKIGSGKDTVGAIIQYLFFRRDIENGVLKDIHYTLNDFLKGISGRRVTDWQIKKFAAKLKQIASLMLGIPVEDFENQEVKDQQLGREWDRPFFIHRSTGDRIRIPADADLEAHARRYAHIDGDKIYYEPITVRQFLQELGTNAVRDQIHTNAWVNALFADYLEDTGYTYPVEPVKMDQYRVLEDPKPYNNGFPNWIITDVRFPNEAQAVEERGGLLIRIERPDPNRKLCRICGQSEREQAQRGCTDPSCYKGRPQHASETALDSYPFPETIINDGSLEDLVEKVRVILIKHNIL